MKPVPDTRMSQRRMATLVVWSLVSLTQTSSHYAIENEFRITMNLGTAEDESINGKIRIKEAPEGQRKGKENEVILKRIESNEKDAISERHKKGMGANEDETRSGRIRILKRNWDT